MGQNNNKQHFAEALKAKLPEMDFAVFNDPVTGLHVIRGRHGSAIHEKRVPEVGPSQFKEVLEFFAEIAKKGSPVGNNSFDPSASEQNEILPKHIQDILSNSEAMVTVSFDKAVIVSMKLPCGLVITESFSFARAKNVNPQRGQEACMAKVIDRIYELESYRILYDNPDQTEAETEPLVVPDRNIITPPNFEKN
jgi:hypothetical protein